MPRPPRLFLSDQPQHIVVRGHNRDSILVRNNDFRFLYQCLKKASQKNRLAIHAWVFMNNHIHLLVTPDNKESLPKTMQSVGRRYAEYFNRNNDRSGTIWDGRYKSSLVDTDYYLLACYRYIELNPVRAGIVNKPEDYPYSSFQANALGKADGLLTPHSLFLEYISQKVSESKDKESDTGGVFRKNAYYDLCAETLDQEMLKHIRRGTEKSTGIGGTKFLLKVSRLK